MDFLGKESDQHMTWQVTPLEPDRQAKFCRFTSDNLAILVATVDGRYFKAPFQQTGEMVGANLLSGAALVLEKAKVSEPLSTF